MEKTNQKYEWCVISTYQKVFRRGYRENEHKVIGMFQTYDEALQCWKNFCGEHRTTKHLIDETHNRKDFWGILTFDIRHWIHIENVEKKSNKYQKIFDEYEKDN